jgi:succinyl-CoA synthetase beta subunit
VRRLQQGDSLSEEESTAFLADHGVPVTRYRRASTADEAADAATMLGFPVVLKVDAVGLLHKSDVGGVRLGLETAEHVRTAFDDIIRMVGDHRPDLKVTGVLVQEMVEPVAEVLVGFDLAEPLGPTIMVGAGGVLTELLRRTALDMLATMNPHDLLERSGIASVLGGYRGAEPADVPALIDAIDRIAAVARGYSAWLEAIEVNPVGVLSQTQGGARVLDALVIPRKDQHGQHDRGE